jgi:hypothetical protein
MQDKRRLGLSEADAGRALEELISPFLVIIDNLHIVAMAIAPNETDSPLIVDSNRMFAHVDRRAKLPIDCQLAKPECVALWRRAPTPAVMTLIEKGGSLAGPASSCEHHDRTRADRSSQPRFQCPLVSTRAQYTIRSIFCMPSCKRKVVFDSLVHI